MDRYNFELNDITDVRMMKINCNRCRTGLDLVPAIVFRGYMTVDSMQDDNKDVVAIFCQGNGQCDGHAWAFPVEPDNSIIQKHDALTPLTTDN